MIILITSGWTLYLFKLVFASYLTLSIIVLINLLIAMMSDTYCRIQEQSDIGKHSNTFHVKINDLIKNQMASSVF